MVADLAYDVAIDGNRAYVADYVGGLRILDVSDPTRPVELGGYDSLESTCRSVVAADSFAFLGWNPNPFFRCILTSDPARPVVVGSGAVQTIPEDMVLRDTLVYLAGNLRFNVVNVARPRQPVLVGSCNLGGDVWDMDMEGDLAYVTSSYFTIIDAARPDSPRVICQWERATAVDVVDTIAYQAYGGLRTVSVANPTSPYLLDSVSVYDITSDVIVIDTLAIVSGYKLHLFNVADPRDIRKVGEWTAPGWGRRLRYSAPYIYAGCFGAGVCILETVTVGMSERAGARPLPSVRLGATLVSGGVELAVQVKGGGPIGIRLFDVTGRMALTRDERGTPGDLTRLRVSVRELPAGVYLVQVRADGTVNTLRFTKVPGR
ncbi:hypothetical protein FJY71_05645 [candidate division WOR-3 bacterium]|nr:hypothetical protein [candidate division WOR-3 bacterium]